MSRSQQIAIRLDVDSLHFIDSMVHQGRARSRADALRRAIELMRREVSAMHDVEIIKEHDGDPYPDLADVGQPSEPLGLD